MLLTSVGPGVPALGPSGWREQVVNWGPVTPGEQNLHVRGFCSGSSGPHLNSHANFISCSFSQRFRDNTSLHHRWKGQRRLFEVKNKRSFSQSVANQNAACCGEALACTGACASPVLRPPEPPSVPLAQAILMLNN